MSNLKKSLIAKHCCKVGGVAVADGVDDVLVEVEVGLVEVEVEVGLVEVEVEVGLLDVVEELEDVGLLEVVEVLDDVGLLEVVEVLEDVGLLDDDELVLEDVGLLEEEELLEVDELVGLLDVVELLDDTGVDELVGGALDEGPEGGVRVGGTPPKATMAVENEKSIEDAKAPACACKSAGAAESKLFSKAWVLLSKSVKSVRTRLVTSIPRPLLKTVT